jgi:hypothetical protein
MAKILAGGFNFKRPTTNEPGNISPQQIEEQAPESWGEYGLRNIAKMPALGYETIRSGLGIGNLLEPLSRLIPDVNVSLPGMPVGGSTFQEARRGLLPTTAEAGKELSFLPKYMTESKPGDWPAEFALTELPFLAAGGAFKSLPKLGSGLAQSISMLGAGQAGQLGGELVGEALGSEQLGGQIGGLLGGIAGQKALSYGVNRPSRYLPEKVKTQQIKTIHNEIADYKQAITNLDRERTKNYSAAQKFEQNKAGSSEPLLKKTYEVANNITEGVDLADQKLITDNLAMLENATRKGEMSLESAKRFQKNFNDQIYNYNMSRNFKKYMGDIVGELNNFITNVGGEEHGKSWQTAEAQTRELKQLKKDEKVFLKEKETAIKQIQKAKGLEFTAKEQGAINKWGLAGLASVAGYFGGGYQAGLLAGGLVKGVQKLKDEIKIVRDVMKNHPDIHNEYKNLLEQYQTMPKATIIKNLNMFGDKLEEAKAQDEKPKGKRIISGGLLSSNRQNYQAAR